MPIPKPHKALANLKRKTVNLSFRESGLPDGEYYMRGGICWPEKVEFMGKIGIEGFAVVAGLDIKTRKLYVFEEFQFVTVQNVAAEDGAIRFYGLSGFLNKVWKTYFANTFYYHQVEEHAKKYKLQVRRSGMVKHQTQFVTVPWSDDSQAAHTMWERLSLGMLGFEKGGLLHNQLNIYETRDKDMLPGVKALVCCLAGIERFPCRVKHEEPVPHPLEKFIEWEQ